ncbi:MAG: heavy metal-binding domain-containing protein [Verrucomicrobiia bacterium]
MKTKTLVIITLAAVLGGSAMWIAPHNLLAADTAAGSHKILYYTCPMHPSVKADKPGNCSICGMALRPVYGDNGGTNTPPAAANTHQPVTTMPGCCSPGGCR